MIDTVVQFITLNWEMILAVLTGLVTVASLIANMTPTETDNKIVAKLAAAINFLALNFKKPKTPEVVDKTDEATKE